MFRKRFAVANTSLLSGKDVKTLRQRIVRAYPSLGVGKGSSSKIPLDALIPAKASLVAQKLADQRGTVYALEGGVPLFFDPDGRQERLVPTIYTLAAFPALLPVLLTWSPVSPRILGGADLFAQGVLRPPEVAPERCPPFLANAVVAVGVPGNPVPFAVGLTCVSRQEAERDGWKGKGVQILHVWGDLLWKEGKGGAVNDGFTAEGIKAIQGEEEGKEEEESDEGRGGERARRGESEGEGESAPPLPSALPPVSSSSSAGAGVDAGDSISMDEALETALLAGVVALKSSDLPIQLSDFYAKYMLPAKPPTLTFDLKASSYKKLGKLVGAFAKKKVLEVKTVRKQECISKVDREHALVAGVGAKLEALRLQETRRQAALASAARAAEDAAARGEAHEGASKDAAAALARARARDAEARPMVQLDDAFRLPSALRQALYETGRGKPDRDATLSRRAVDAALRRACYRRMLFRAPGGKPIPDAERLAAELGEGEREGPADGAAALPPLPAAPARATADDLLRHAILNKGEAFPFEEGAPYEALLAKVLARCTRFVRLRAPWTPPEGTVSRGDPTPVTVAAAKRRGHPVTVVGSVEALGLDPKDVASELQRRFQASTTVGEFPGAAGVVVVLQGDATERVAEMLAEKYGIPPKLIDVKTSKKKGGKK